MNRVTCTIGNAIKYSGQKSNTVLNCVDLFSAVSSSTLSKCFVFFSVLWTYLSTSGLLVYSFLYMTPNIYSFCLSIKLSVSPFLSLFSSLPTLSQSPPPCLPAPGSVSSFTEQLKVTGTEREGEGGRDRGRTHHSIAWGYTTVEEEREMEGQREERLTKVLTGNSINR